MKRVVISFLLGVAVGAGSYWYLDTHPTEVDAAQKKVAHQAEAAAQTVKQRVGQVTVSNIIDELSRGGTVIREKAVQAGEAIAGATADPRLTAAIKTKLIAEPGLSALKINVDTRDGEVTLSGTVSATGQVARAMNIALETEGVRKVTSHLQVAPPGR